MKYIGKLGFTCKIAFSGLFVVVMLTSLPALAQSADYYIKIGDIKGESEENKMPGDPIPGIDITVGADSAGDVDSDGREETQTTGIEPDEIDYDNSQKTNFGVLLDSGNNTDDSDETEESNAANTGVEPDEIDLAMDNETNAAVDVFIKIPPIDGESTERMVGLDGLYIDYRDEDSDDDGIEANHEAEITLKGEAESKDSMQAPYKTGTHIRVDAQMVRAWDPETKKAVRTHLVENDTKNEVTDIALFIALQTLDNEEITNINVEDDTTVVEYKAKLAIFGFITVETNAEAKIDKNGEVKTKYPWWSFLAKKISDETTYTDIASQISKRIAIEEEGVPAVDEKH